MDQEFYSLEIVNKIFPNFWGLVKVNFIKKEGITIQQLNKFNNDANLLGVQTLSDVNTVLSKSHQELAKKLQDLYKKGKQNYSGDRLQPTPAQLFEQYYVLYYQQSFPSYYQQYAHYGYQTAQQYAASYAQQYATTTAQQLAYGPQPQQINSYYSNQTGQQNQSNYGGYHHGQRNRQHYQHKNNYNKYQNYEQNTSVNETSQVQITKAQSSTNTYQSEKHSQPEPVKEEPVKLQKKKLSIEQIRKMIASIVDKEQLKKSVTPKLIEEIEEVNKWDKKVESIQIQVQQDKNQNPQNKKGGKDHYQKQKSYDNNNKQFQFNRGARYNKIPSNVGPTFDIQIGKNQNLQTKLVKNQLKKKAAQGDFAQRKQQEQRRLGKIQSIKRQILFNLNRVAPQNLKDIFKQIQNYALQQHQVCSVLVNSIIEKAWEQPKYAASYAKLSSYFGKIQTSKFKFNPQEKKKKNNPFKFILIERVQHSFDKKQKKNIPENQDDLQKYAKQTKNLIMGNVKFIAQLIKIKLINKNIIRYCISNLLNNFFQGRSRYIKNKQTENNFYQFYFQAIIQFIQNLGQKFEQIDKNQKQQKGDKQQKQQKEDTKQENKQAGSQLKLALQKVKQFCQLKQPFKQSQVLLQLKAGEYFEVFQIVNKFALPQAKDGNRLSALLQNLQERRAKNWMKHNVQSQGPKKLKDLGKQQETPQQRQKADAQYLDKSMQKVLKKWVQKEEHQVMKQLDSLKKRYSSNDLICSYLKFVSDDKKDQIPRRIQLFDIISKYFTEKQFYQTWKKSIGNIAFLSSQFPFCPAALSKILMNYKQKKSINFSDYFIKFDEDEQQDEYYFMDQIFQKLYHYSKNQDLKSLIQPKNKLSHLL